ncbi:hypothetical protein Tco_0741934, partial [Tanacetum coccineum]
NQQTHLAEFPQIDFSLAVPVFKQGDDPIDAINKMMSFLFTAITSCFPSTNNQLRNSSNPRQQATSHDGWVTVQPLQERQNSYAADPGIAKGPVTQSVITHNAAFQADDLDAYDSNCDEISTTKSVLMDNLSSYGKDVLSEVPIFKNTNNDMLNQSVQEMSYSEPSYFVEHPKNEIYSDSNIILYSQYLTESQNAAIQDTNSFAQQDALILSVFKQLSNQVTNYNKINNENFIANETLSAKLERYKERVKLLEERQNVDLGKELLTKTFNVFKNESKEKETKYIDTKIALEKKVKELDNILCKMVQSAQTIRPMLYDGNVIAKETNVISIADSEETLMVEEESRSKMLLKQSDPMVLQNKVNTKTIDYAELNRLSKDFGNRFVPQQELSDEQALHLIIDQFVSSPIKIKAHWELPKMEVVVQQYNVDKQCFEIQKKQFLIENDRLLDQIIAQDIVNIVVNSSVDPNTSINVNSSVAMIESVKYVEMCNKFLELKVELIKQHNMVEKDEKKCVIKALKNDLRKLKGKDKVDNAAQVSNATTIAPGMYKLDPLIFLGSNAITIAPGMYKLDLVILAPKVKNNREAHEYYLKHTMEQAAILRELIQESLGYVRDTCPNIHKPSEKLVAVTSINKKKIVRFADTVTSSNNIPNMTNRPSLSSTGVKTSTSASRSKPSGNTKNDRISRPPSSNEKNKVEVQSRKVKSKLNKQNSDSKNVYNKHVKHPIKGAQALCSVCNKCLFDANHAMWLIDHVNSMNVRTKSASNKNKKRKE